MRRLRAFLGLPVPDRRTSSRDVPIPPLSSTSAELARTRPAHKARIRKADRVLDDYRRMDGALRLVAVRRDR